MTCREKLKIEHPECVDEGFYGGCKGCPDDYGYADTRESCSGIRCAECWDCEVDPVPDDISVATAKEIFEEIERNSSYCVASHNGEEIYETKTYTISALKLAELKKKYTEDKK